MTQQEHKRRAFFEKEILSTICTIGFNGDIRKRCSKCGDYQTPLNMDSCHNCKSNWDISPITVKDVLLSTSHLKFGTKSHYVGALNLKKLRSNGFTIKDFEDYCLTNYNIKP